MRRNEGLRIGLYEPDGVTRKPGSGITAAGKITNVMVHVSDGADTLTKLGAPGKYIAVSSGATTIIGLVTKPYAGATREGMYEMQVLYVAGRVGRSDNFVTGWDIYGPQDVTSGSFTIGEISPNGTITTGKQYGAGSSLQLVSNYQTAKPPEPWKQLKLKKFVTLKGSGRELFIDTEGLIPKTPPGDIWDVYNAKLISFTGPNVRSGESFQLSRNEDTLPADHIPIIDVANPSFTKEADGPNTTVTAAELGVTVFDSYNKNAVPISDQGLTFPIGEKLITWSYKSPSGREAVPKTTRLTVQDTTAPVITTTDINVTLPPGISAVPVNLGLQNGVTVTDNFPIKTLVNDLPGNPSEFFFGIGTTIVTWTATDQNGNVATEEQKVVITPTFGKLAQRFKSIEEPFKYETPYALREKGLNMWGVQNKEISRDGVKFKPNVGFPRCGVYFQGRLWLASSLGFAGTIWASRLEDFGSFEIKTGTGTGSDKNADGDFNDDAPIQVTASGANSVEFYSIYPGRHLQFFADSAEYYIPVSDSQAITPKNISLRNTTSVGILENVFPFEVDGIVYFAQRGGHAIRSFLFSEGTRAYNTESVSLLSSHLINNPVDAALKKSISTRDSDYIWVVNKDGTLAIFSVLAAQKVNAWSLMHTHGIIEKIAVLEQSSYLLTTRDKFRGGAKIVESYVEVMSDKMLLDCGFIKSVDKETSEVADNTLNHYIGEEFDAVVDGVYIGKIKVDVGDKGAVIRFPIPVKKEYQIGVRFEEPFGDGNEVVVETLPADVLLEEGTTVGKKKRTVECTVRVKDTQSLFIDDAPCEFRTLPFDLGTAVEPYSGNFTVHGMLGWDEYGKIRLTQKIPQKMNVIGIAYTLTTE